MGGQDKLRCLLVGPVQADFDGGGDAIEIAVPVIVGLAPTGSKGVPG